MKKITFVALAALALSSCNSGPQFKVNGVVSDANGKMLYLESSALEGIIPLDSVKLKGNGSFSFRQARPESPEFYRLRVDDKVINFSVDSTETIEIKAPYVDFAAAYTVEGSENSQKIKELSLKQARLQNRVNALLAAARSNKLGHDVFEDSLSVLLKNYKDDVKVNYIFAAPNTAAAYFALFQKLNDYLIFDPLNSKDDIKCFAAVATSLNNSYPHAIRSKNLYNIVIKGMKNTRAPKQKTIEIPEDKIAETGVIDISLRDIQGNVRKLSELKGKVVLLDFSVYQTQAGAPHNLMLRELYNKYANQGFEIYQVSLDADEHFWKTSADNLPWICVRDGNGIYSNTAALYNVRQVPAFFLVNRNNELSARGEDVKDFDMALRSAMREDPDVILVGEMRDYETISAVITLAETGHLVFSTLHTIGAAKTIDRIIDIFPQHKQAQVRTQLSGVLNAVITQTLLPHASGIGRVAAVEIMRANDAVRNLIRDNKGHQINSVIQTGKKEGMISLNHALANLVREGKITLDTAKKCASDISEFKQYLQ